MFDAACGRCVCDVEKPNKPVLLPDFVLIVVGGRSVTGIWVIELSVDCLTEVAYYFPPLLLESALIFEDVVALA